MASFTERSQALWRRSPPRAKRAAVMAAAALVLWGMALGAANRPAARARLRASIRDALAKRLPGTELGDSVTVDPLFRLSFGPLTVHAERQGAPPIFRADRVRVRARFWALLTGRVEPASVRFYGVRIYPGERLRELRALAERMRPRPGPAAASEEPLRSTPRDWPAIHLRSAVLVLRHEGRELEVGPLDASVLRQREDESDEVEVAVSHRKGGRAWVQLHRQGGAYRLRASALEIPAGVLPSELATASVAWSGGTFSADLSLAGKADAMGTGRLRARVAQGWFSGERLAPEPLGPITVDLDGALELVPSSRRFALRDGSIRCMGAVDARLDAEGQLAPGLPFSVAVDAPAVDFAALTDALPSLLRPPSDAPAPSGPLSFRLALSGFLREPSAWKVEAALDLAKLREAAQRAPPARLRSSFTWHPEVAQGEPPSIRIGPENPAFVALADLPEHVVRAVTTSEDAGFFGHSGFDFEELRNAFAQGTEAGRVVRGASTITQQLAKNLYLSREKTLIRKAREALVAIELEASIPKARLLEIYLNIAEWGPGIWGIGSAAQHYFGKPASDLTVREAAFLASVIPNPVRYHGYYTRGELDEAWIDRLRVILLHMAEAGAITEAQLVDALDAPLQFASRTASLEAGVIESAPTPSPSPPVREREVIH